MFRVFAAVAMPCVLLTACSVDRLPIATEELSSDSGHYDAATDVADAGVDAMLAHDASTLNDASDGAIDDAGDASDAAMTDAGNHTPDAAVDAFVPPPRFDGPCDTDHDCELDETCVRSQGLVNSHSYCSQRCRSDIECERGDVLSGGAPRCTSSGRCRLPCDAVLGDGCPNDMVCQDLLLLLPVGDGTCSFER